MKKLNVIILLLFSFLFFSCNNCINSYAPSEDSNSKKIVKLYITQNNFSRAAFIPKVTESEISYYNVYAFGSEEDPKSFEKLNKSEIDLELTAGKVYAIEVHGYTASDEMIVYGRESSFNSSSDTLTITVTPFQKIIDSQHINSNTIYQGTVLLNITFPETRNYDYSVKYSFISKDSIVSEHGKKEHKLEKTSLEKNVSFPVYTGSNTTDDQTPINCGDYTILIKIEYELDGTTFCILKSCSFAVLANIQTKINLTLSESDLLVSNNSSLSNIALFEQNSDDSVDYFNSIFNAAETEYSIQQPKGFTGIKLKVFMGVAAQSVKIETKKSTDADFMPYTQSPSEIEFIGDTKAQKLSYELPDIFDGATNTVVRITVSKGASVTTYTITFEPPANTYYVKSDGNDANSGSKNEPFKSIQKAVDTIITENSTADGNPDYTIVLLSDITAAQATDFYIEGDAGSYVYLDSTKLVNITIVSDGSECHKVSAGGQSIVISAATNGGRCIYVGNHVNLTLENVQVTGGYLLSADDTGNGAGIYVNAQTNPSSVTLKENCVIGAKQTHSVDSGTQVQSWVTTSSDNENSAYNGAGVYLKGNATLTMESGSAISKNYGLNAGAGLYISDNCTAEIHEGAEIYANNSELYGSVFVAGNLELKGSVHHNYSNRCAGIYIQKSTDSSSEVTVNETASICDNFSKSESCGGAITVANSEFISECDVNIAGGTIKNNVNTANSLQGEIQLPKNYENLTLSKLCSLGDNSTKYHFVLNEGAVVAIKDSPVQNYSVLVKYYSPGAAVITGSSYTLTTEDCNKYTATIEGDSNSYNLTLSSNSGIISGYSALSPSFVISLADSIFVSLDSLTGIITVKKDNTEVEPSEYEIVSAEYFNGGALFEKAVVSDNVVTLNQTLPYGYYELNIIILYNGKEYTAVFEIEK